MSEFIKVRRVLVEVLVSREIVVVVPEGMDPGDLRSIIKDYDMSEVTNDQEAEISIGEVREASVNPKDPDLYVIDQGGLGPAKGCDWMKPENIGKYAVKTKEPHPEG